MHFTLSINWDGFVWSGFVIWLRLVVWGNEDWDGILHPPYFLFSFFSEIGGTGRSTVGNILAATKPDLIIEVDGDKYTLSTVTPLQSIKVSYTLNQEYEIELKKANDHTECIFLDYFLCIAYMQF